MKDMLFWLGAALIGGGLISVVLMRLLPSKMVFTFEAKQFTWMRPEIMGLDIDKRFLTPLGYKMKLVSYASLLFGFLVVVVALAG